MKFLIAIFLFFFFSSIGYSQKKESVLWEISGKGLTKKSYLFGTVHVASADALNKFPELLKVMHNSNIALFESGGKPINDFSKTEEEIHHTFSQPPLDSIFSPKEYLLVDSFFSGTELGSIKPHNQDADLASMLQVVIAYKNNNGKQLYTFDDHLRKRMDSLGKGIYQLDNVNDKSKNAFLSQYRQLAEVLVAVIKMSDDKTSSLFYEDSYKKFLKSDLKLKMQPDQEMGKVTIDRNLAWLPKVIEKINTDACFIAVGLGHLQYKTGLINLLRTKGYILKPVNLD